QLQERKTGRLVENGRERTVAACGFRENAPPSREHCTEQHARAQELASVHRIPPTAKLPMPLCTRSADLRLAAEDRCDRRAGVTHRSTQHQMRVECEYDTARGVDRDQPAFAA